MDVNSFLQRIRAQLTDLADTLSRTPGTGVAFPDLLFTDVFTAHMADAGVTFAPQVCHYSATLPDGPVRVSGYALSADTEQLDLYVSVYSGSDTPLPVSAGDLLDAGEQCIRFLRLCGQGILSAYVDESHDAYALVQTLSIAFSSLSRIRVYILTDGLSDVHDIPACEIDGKTVDTAVIDIASLCGTENDDGLRDGFQVLADFRAELLAGVRSAAARSGGAVATAFAEDAGARLADAEEIPDFQLCVFASDDLTGGPMRVDGYAFDDADASLALMVSDFSGSDEFGLISDSDVGMLKGLLVAYAGSVFDGRLTRAGLGERNPGAGLASDIEARRADIARLRLYIATDRMAGAAAPGEEFRIAGIPAEVHLWDVARFHKAFTSEGGKDHFEVDFRADSGKGLPALHAGSACGEYEGYLCTISGDVLARVYEKYGSRLLEGNVRSFLSVKGKINAGIQTTIQDKPAMFFAYNNGIAATADEVVLEEGNVLRISLARNFQIVNGGQTTASLAAAARVGADLSAVVVQMKLSVLPPARAGELIPLIARFANSQNKVNESDFFANHPYHARLEQISRRITMAVADGGGAETVWFYERFRGQFANEQKYMGRKQKNAFLIQHPKHQLLTKLDVARLENTWKGFPQKVSTGAQKNFIFFASWLAKAWTKNDHQFDDGYFRNLAAMSMLYAHTEALVAQQQWYQGAYRPNIVTYSLALLQFTVLMKGRGRQLDLNHIWSTQQIPDSLSTFLELLTATVFKVLTDPGRPKANVTEWAKAEGCWDAVRERAPALSAEVYALLEDPATARARDADAAMGNQIGYGVFASTAVKGIDAAVWSDLLQWGCSQELLNPMEVKLLRSATRLPRFAPTLPECEKIWSLRTRLIRRGYGRAAAGEEQH